jgi:suppressor of fused-like protein
LPLHGPIEQGSSTLLHAAIFLRDPQLPPVATPNGRVEFLQVVGLTLDELEAISSWNAAAFLELRRRDDPLLLTDLSRASWLADASFAAQVARRTKQEGSSCGWLAIVLECDTKSDPVCVRVQSIAVDGLKRRLLGRLPYGRELTLNGKDATVVFKPGKQSRMRLVEDAVTITLRDDHLVEFAELLRPHAGVCPVPGVKNVVLQVLRTEITDRHGKVVDVVE